MIRQFSNYRHDITPTLRNIREGKIAKWVKEFRPKRMTYDQFLNGLFTLMAFSVVVIIWFLAWITD